MIRTISKSNLNGIALYGIRINHEFDNLVKIQELVKQENEREMLANTSFGTMTASKLGEIEILQNESDKTVALIHSEACKHIELTAF